MGRVGKGREGMIGERREAKKWDREKRIDGKGRVGKGREGKEREKKGREGKRREGKKRGLGWEEKKKKDMARKEKK